MASKGPSPKEAPGVEVPDTIELCVRDKDRSPCLGVIHRLEPDGRIYCTRCGGREPGAIYVRQSLRGTRP